MRTSRHLRKLVDEVQRVLSKTPEFAAYSCPRRNVLMGQTMKAGGWWPDRQARLLNRLEAKYTGAVHERIDLAPAAVGRLSNEIRHRSHSTLDEVLERVDSYSGAEAVELEANGGRRPTRLEILVVPWLHFLGRFLVRQGFRDGQVGLAEARIQAYYRYLTLLRCRKGPDSQPSSIFRRLIPKTQPAVKEDAPPGQSLSPFSVRDPLAIGLAALLLLLPFHLLIKSAAARSAGPRVEGSDHCGADVRRTLANARSHAHFILFLVDHAVDDRVCGTGTRRIDRFTL